MRLLRGLVRHLIPRRGYSPGSGDPPGGEEGVGWYDSVYRNSEAYRPAYPTSHYYFLWAVIVDRIRRDRGARVLEVGCGSGQLAHFLADQGVRDYDGIDFSPEAIRLALERLPEKRFRVGDARDPLTYAGGPYHWVVCTEVLEHVAEDLLVVSHFPARARCVCSVPNFPYKGHMRFFRDEAEVRDRYGPYFEGPDVVRFTSPRCADDAFFLFDGVRNDRTAPTR